MFYAYVMTGILAYVYVSLFLDFKMKRCIPVPPYNVCIGHVHILSL